MNSKKRVIGLVSRICSYWRPHVDEEEVAFYRRMLKEVSGTALELACGGGRLILRFLREGFVVEGVDSCPFLLDVLAKKAKKAGRQ
jgi:SAM-dependent methyltransferase